MKVLIATNNPGKIQSAKEAFECYFENVEVEGHNIPSGVSDEPVDEEIYQGAHNRAVNIKAFASEKNLSADFFVGVESGITNKLGKWMITNVAVILDKNGNEGFGTSPSFPIPERYVEETIKFGLGNLMDKIFNANQLSKSVGGISFLTHEKISRIDLSREAFIMALTQFINGDTWKN